MSEFRTVLDTHLVCEFDGTDALDAPLVYWSDLLQVEIVVPAGFVTDYASVPRVVGAYLLVGGKGKRASVVHDWLYSCATYAREICDQVFKEALAATGYSALTISLMYAGVRMGGAGHFTKPNVPQAPHVEAAMLEAP